MSKQLEAATKQRLEALASSTVVSRDAAVDAYGDGDGSALTREESSSPPIPDYSQVPRDSIAVESKPAGLDKWSLPHP